MGVFILDSILCVGRGGGNCIDVDSSNFKQNEAKKY